MITKVRFRAHNDARNADMVCENINWHATGGVSFAAGYVDGTFEVWFADGDVEPWRSIDSLVTFEETEEKK